MSSIGASARVVHWQLWKGEFTDAQAALIAPMQPLFDEMKASSDHHLSDWYDHTQWRWKRWEYATVLAHLPLGDPGTRVMDAGCGYTPLVRYLGGLGMQAYGFDWDMNPAESQLGRAASLLHGDRVTFSNQDMRRMDWPPDYFDYTVSVSVLEHLFFSPHFAGKVYDYFLPPQHKYFHVENLASAVRDLIRVTKPGGNLLLTMDCGYGDALRLSVIEKIFGIAIDGFPDAETLRSYWTADPYYSQRNQKIPSTPRGYTSLFLHLEKAR
jgi:SAM-dependent methyltransferase